MKQKALRAEDYLAISKMMLIRMAGPTMSQAERDTVFNTTRSEYRRELAEWGPINAVIGDALRLINLKRAKDGRPKMSRDGLQAAIRSYISNDRSDPRMDEFSDAMSNLRSIRLGLDKFEDYPPLDEGHSPKKTGT